MQIFLLASQNQNFDNKILNQEIDINQISKLNIIINNEKFNKLSSGEKQKVLLARAILRILDNEKINSQLEINNNEICLSKDNDILYNLLKEFNITKKQQNSTNNYSIFQINNNSFDNENLY